MCFMGWAEIKKRETFVWHHRFMPSLIAGAAVAFVTLFFEVTAPNVVLFASLGGSAVILTHKYVHKLNILRTILLSYLCSLIVSLIMLWALEILSVPFSVVVLIAVTGTTMVLYLVDAFHPPAIAASLAFILYEGSIGETFAIWGSVILLLMVIKIFTYVFYYQHLTLKEFLLEFKRWEDVEWEALEERVKGNFLEKKKKSRKRKN